MGNAKGRENCSWFEVRMFTKSLLIYKQSSTVKPGLEPYLLQMYLILSDEIHFHTLSQRGTASANF